MAALTLENSGVGAFMGGIVMAQDTRAELMHGIGRLRALASELVILLEGGCTKVEFINALHKGDIVLKELKSVVVKHSRSRGEGIRYDGKKDLRHKKWKIEGEVDK